MVEMTANYEHILTRPGLDRPTAGFLLNVCLSAPQLLCRGWAEEWTSAGIVRAAAAWRRWRGRH